MVAFLKGQLLQRVYPVRFNSAITFRYSHLAHIGSICFAVLRLPLLTFGTTSKRNWLRSSMHGEATFAGANYTRAGGTFLIYLTQHHGAIWFYHRRNTYRAAVRFPVTNTCVVPLEWVISHSGLPVVHKFAYRERKQTLMETLKRSARLFSAALGLLAFRWVLFKGTVH